MQFRRPSWPALRPLLLRAIVVFSISAGFAYLPVTFSPYRHTLLLLNHGQPTRTANLRMHELGARYRKRMPDRTALLPSNLPGEPGRRGSNGWGMIPRPRSSRKSAAPTSCFSMPIPARPISSTHVNTTPRHSAPTAWPTAPTGNCCCMPKTPLFRRGKQVWGLNNIAYCYNYLQQFAQSDTYFLRAAQTHRRVCPDSTADLALLGVT